MVCTHMKIKSKSYFPNYLSVKHSSIFHPFNILMTRDQNRMQFTYSIRCSKYTQFKRKIFTEMIDSNSSISMYMHILRNNKCLGKIELRKSTQSPWYDQPELSSQNLVSSERFICISLYQLFMQDGNIPFHASLVCDTCAHPFLASINEEIDCRTFEYKWSNFVTL